MVPSLTRSSILWAGNGLLVCLCTLSLGSVCDACSLRMLIFFYFFLFVFFSCYFLHPCISIHASIQPLMTDGVEWLSLVLLCTCHPETSIAPPGLRHSTARPSPAHMCTSITQYLYLSLSISLTRSCSLNRSPSPVSVIAAVDHL